AKKDSHGELALSLDTAHSGQGRAKVTTMKQGTIFPDSKYNAQTGPYSFKVHYYTGQSGNPKIKLRLRLYGEDGYLGVKGESSKIPTSDTTGEWQEITLHQDIPDTLNNQEVTKVMPVVRIFDQQDVPLYLDDARFYQEDNTDNLIE